MSTKPKKQQAKANKEKKEAQPKAKPEASKDAQPEEEENEQRGIIPEGLDMKKFLGCGG